MISPSNVRTSITAEQIALLQAGLQEPPNHPAHDVAVKVVDHLLGDAFKNLPSEQGRALMRVCYAPIALRAAEVTLDLRTAEVELLRGQVKELEARWSAGQVRL